MSKPSKRDWEREENENPKTQERVLLRCVNTEKHPCPCGCHKNGSDCESCNGISMSEHRSIISHIREEAEQFTQQELDIMWLDYKALVATTKMMNRQVVGDKKLEFILDSNDQIREEILAKLDKLSTLKPKEEV